MENIFKVTRKIGTLAVVIALLLLIYAAMMNDWCYSEGYTGAVLHNGHIVCYMNNRDYYPIIR